MRPVFDQIECFFYLRTISVKDLMPCTDVGNANRCRPIPLSVLEDSGVLKMLPIVIHNMKDQAIV